MNDTARCTEVLANLLYPHLLETEDLVGHLVHTERVVRTIAEEAVAINLERMDDEIKAQVPKDWRVLDRPARTLITLVGQVTYRRRAYRDGYGCRRYLLDEILGIGAYQRIEANAFLWIVKRSADVSYEKTSKAFCERSGVLIARTTVMRCVHKEGELLAQADAQTTQSQAVSTPVIFTEFDGFWVNIQTPSKGRKASPAHLQRAV